ncbi:hypothetical protein BH10ACT1_BH10ACT1_40140 [soil metagenome]
MSSIPVSATRPSATRPSAAEAADLFTQLGSGFGRPSAAPKGSGTDLDRSPSARRVALVPGRPRLVPAPSPDQLDIATIVDIATGLASAEGLWRPHVDHDPVSRTSVRLVSTPVYEVWLLGWTPGQRVELHDHGGANAAFVVVDGELDELTLVDGEVRSSHLVTGDVGTVASGAIHDVVNRGTVEATSLHVYADPLRTMTFYDDHGMATFTELVEEVPALVSAPTASRALHPAARR